MARLPVGLLYGAMLLGVLSAAPALMPLPVKLDPGSGALAIDEGFAISTAECRDARMAAAASRSTARIARQTGLPIGIGKLPAVLLRVECSGAGAEYPSLMDDESYQLDVSSEGARLTAPTGAGALHGLETFAQLIESGPNVETGPNGFHIAAVHIEDRPRFPWRGLMLDVARHWMPVEVVERNLNAMAAVKLNVFHWHLSDDQGFRVESKRFPRLQEMGSDGNFYTQAQIRQVVGFARDRGIRVIPEFDIPGHTQSWLAAYPELASEPTPTGVPYEIGRTWGAFDPVMDPTREEVYQFLDAFLGEMSELFPDAYFHIGGDEVNPKQWNRSPSIQAFARQHKLKDAHALQAYFNQRIEKILAAHGKIMIGWDEILDPDLPPSIVIQSWRGLKSLADASKQGRRGILSWGYYLDYLRPASEHYGIDPPADANVLGGEACMWAEYVSAETVDSRIWPRAAAIAERLWSQREVNDVDSMYARLEVVSRTLEWTGVRHRASYGPMLDRLTSGRPSGALRVLADASEAQGLSGRSRAAKYTSLTPLNRFVDAVPPESEAVRGLEQAARRATPADLAALRDQFTIWASNDARFPALTELKPLSQDLSELGAMGLRILDYLGGRQTLPANWVAEQTRELTRMEKPTAEVILAAVRPVKLLLSQLKR
jgi:hexosaminidase